MEKEEREGELNATTQKKWSTPQLIVLVRGRPEEGVLVVCKVVGFGASGPLGRYSACGDFPWSEISAACLMAACSSKSSS